MTTIMTSVAALLLCVQNDNISTINDLVKYYKDHFAIEDIEYVYEGNVYNAANGDPKVIQGYSGNYVLRMLDNKNKFVCDTYIDVFTKKPKDEALLYHYTMTAINGESQVFTHPIAASPATKNIVTKKARYSGNFRKSYSPDLIINSFTWWQLLKPDTRITPEFDVLGIQHDDDGDFLLVTRDPNRLAGKPTKVAVQDRFLLSPSHGYQVKKYERMESGQKVESLLVKEFIKLKISTKDNKFIDSWYPLMTEYSSYVHDVNDVKKTPVLTCITTILKETVIVNQHPPDSRFSVFYAYTDNQKLQLSRLKREFEYEKTFTKKTSENKSDVYKEALEKQLAAVNEQSQELNFAQNKGSWVDLLVNKWVFATLLLVVSVTVLLMLRRYPNSQRRPGN